MPTLEEIGNALPSEADQQRWDKLLSLGDSLPDEGQEAKGSFIPESGKALAAGVGSGVALTLKGAAGRQEVARADRAQMFQTAVDAIKQIKAGKNPDEIYGSMSDPDAQMWVKTYLDQTSDEERDNVLAGVEKLTGIHPARKPQETELYKYGKQAQDWTDEQFKAAKDYENSVTRKIGEVIGNMGVFAAAGAVNPAIAMDLGVSMSAGEGIDAAIKKGATKEQILQVANLGFAPGITEAAPLEVLYNKIPFGKWGKLTDALIRIGANYAAEGGQELVQQFMQNVISKYVYNPDQDLTEGLKESFVYGGIGGAAAGVVAAPFQYGAGYEETPPPRTEPPPPGAEEAGAVLPEEEVPTPPGYIRTSDLPAAPALTPEQTTANLTAAWQKLMASGRSLDELRQMTPEETLAAAATLPAAPTPAGTTMVVDDPGGPLHGMEVAVLKSGAQMSTVRDADGKTHLISNALLKPFVGDLVKDVVKEALQPPPPDPEKDRPDSPRLTDADRNSPIPNSIIDDGKRAVEAATGEESKVTTAQEIGGHVQVTDTNVSDIVARDRAQTQALVDRITAGVAPAEIAPQTQQPAPPASAGVVSGVGTPAETIAAPPAAPVAAPLSPAVAEHHAAANAPSPDQLPAIPGTPMAKQGDTLADQIKKLKARSAAYDAQVEELAASGTSIRMVSNRDPTKKVLIGPDMSEQDKGKFRVTYIDQHGPSGHTVHNTMQDAARQVIGSYHPIGQIDQQVVRQDVAYTPGGREVPVTYAIVSADDLVTSQKDEGGANPAYPQELQPRDRSRGTSDQQINSIAQNLNPALLDNNASATDGAPIVSADGVVESGNGRVLGIRRAYNQNLPGAQAYRDYLASQGYFDVTASEGIKNPVLVRIRRGALEPDARAAFAREANERTTLAMSATEKAMADAAAMSPETVGLFRGGEVADAGNRDFVRSFMQGVVNPNEQAAMVTPDGGLSQEAIRRVQGALLARAYGDADLVGTLLESPDTNIKAIGGALMDVAGLWAQMRTEAKAGDINPEVDITPAALEAVRLVERARSEGRPLTEFVNQKDIFSGQTISPEAEAVLRLMFRNTASWTMPAGRAKIAEALTFFATEARKTSAGVDLLGETAPPASKILETAKARQYGQEETQAKLPSGDRTAGKDTGEPSQGRSVEAKPGAQAEGRPSPAAKAPAGPKFSLGERVAKEVKPGKLVVGKLKAAVERLKAERKAKQAAEEEATLAALKERMNTPEIRAGIARMDAIPLTDLEDGTGPYKEFGPYNSDQWWESRVYNFGKDKVRGFANAIPLLIDRARNLAVKELNEDRKKAGKPLLESYTPDRNRRATIIIGEPGAGKSGIANPVALKNRAAIVDVDDAKQVIPEYQDGIGANAVHEESSVMGREVLAELASNGDNLVIPKIGHTLDSIEKLREDLTKFGYKVELMLMRVTPETALTRMLKRFKSKGRLINPTYFLKVVGKPVKTYVQAKRIGKFDAYSEVTSSDTLPNRVSEATGAAKSVERGQIIERDGTIGPAGSTAGPSVQQGGRPVQGQPKFSKGQYPLAPRSEWHGEANFQQAGGRMVTMSPDEFLARARPLTIDEVSRENIDDLKRHIQSGKTLDPLKFFASGKEDGRHRAIAAKELGIKQVPVIEFGQSKLKVGAPTTTTHVSPKGGRAESRQVKGGQIHYALGSQFAPKAEAFLKDFRKILDSYGLTGVEVKGWELIFADLKSGAFGVEGQYLHSLIDVALTSKDPTMTLHHEAVHALFDLALSPSEKAILLRKSNKEWITNDIKKRYGAFSQAVQAEEGVAHAYVRWLEGERMDGMIARSFKRIKTYLKALLQALTKYDIRTADDVFRQMASGEIGRRTQVAQSASGARFAATETVDMFEGPREQYVIPGAEKLTDAQLAQRRANEKLQAKKIQKSVDSLPLFGDQKDQMSLFQIGYHRSKSDFDKFSNASLGTGIGQQYGAGHYFATREGELQTSWGNNLYKVDIPDSADMMQWDEPIDKMSKGVQAKLEKLFDKFGSRPKAAEYPGPTPKNIPKEKWRAIWDNKDQTFAQREAAEQALIDEYGGRGTVTVQPAGASVYSWLMDQMGTSDDRVARRGYARQASEELANAGILGHEYKEDNYDGVVVYDDQDIKVLSRNGKPVTADERATAIAESHPAVQEARFSIDAWHGTPHEVQRFTTEKIGTGEGHQAYGWGLYFAGLKSVAEYYRKGLTDRARGMFEKDGSPFQPKGELEQEFWTKAQASPVGLEAIRANYQENLDHVLKRLKEPEKMLPEWRVQYVRDAAEYKTKLDAIDAMMARAHVDERKEGRLYKVTLPDRENLMSFENLLADQPAKVKKAFETLGIRKPSAQNVDPELKAILDASGAVREPWRIATEITHNRALVARSIAWITKQGWTAPSLGGLGQFMVDRGTSYIDSKNPDELGVPDSYTGRQAYYDLALKLGSDQAASEALREQGVPGHMYYDEKSRPEDSSATKHWYERRIAIQKERIKNYKGGYPKPDYLQAEIGGWEAGIRDLEKASHNYVIYDDKAVGIEARFALTAPPATSQQAQQTMQGFLNRGQPIDRALRFPFELLGGLDAQGRWRLGKRLSDRMGPAGLQGFGIGGMLGAGVGTVVGGPVGTVAGLFAGGTVGAKILGSSPHPGGGRFGWFHGMAENAKRGLIDGYGLDPAYIETYRKSELGKAAILRQTQGIMKVLSNAGVGTNEAKVLQNILSGEPVNDADMTRLAVPIRQAIDDLGAEAVSLGLISAESFQRNRGAYLHRVYVKNEVDQNTLAGWVSAKMSNRRKKIIGDELKGRGMFMDIEGDRLMRDVESFNAGKRGAAVLGEKFHVIDEVSSTASLTPGGTVKEKVLRRVYLPANEAVPTKYTGPNWVDRGTWEVRKAGKKPTLWRDYTKAERGKMGELVDARYTIAKTFMLMANDLSTGRFFKDVAQKQEWTSSMPPAAKWKEASEYSRYWNDPEIQWVKVPDTNIDQTGGKKRWGALAGKFVRAEIWRDLNEVNIANNPGTWRKLYTQWKRNKTARHPGVHMNNVMSNVVFMDLADIRTQDLVAGIKAYAGSSKDYQEALDNGAFGSDQMSQEIRENVLKPILEEITKQQTGALNPFLAKAGMAGVIADKLWTWAKAADNGMLRAYQAEDEIFRMATYMRRRAQGESPRVAAQEARDQFLNYDIRAPWVVAMRNTLFPFISYTYRAVPKLAENISNRPWKVAKYAAIAYAVNALAYLWDDGDDGEDKERAALRDEEQGHTWLGTPRMLRMPWRDQHGLPVFLDIRRWVPAGDIFDTTQGSSALPIPAPLHFGGPLQMAFEFMFNRQAFTGEDITNDLTQDAGEQFTTVADWAWKSWAPGSFWTPRSWYWTKIANAVYGATDTAGHPYSVPQAVLSSLGIKVKPVDVENGIMWHFYDFKKVQTALKKDLRSLSRQLERGLISQKAFDSGEANIMEKFENLGRNIDEFSERIKPKKKAQ